MGNAIFTKDSSANWNRVRNVRWHDTTQFNRADAVFWDQLWGLIGTATYTNRDSGLQLSNPNIAVEGTKVYTAWLEYTIIDPLHASWQLWTASMNTDGTGWAAVQRTAAILGGESLADLQMISIPGDKLYFVWASSHGGASHQVWTGDLTFDLATWNATQRTADAGVSYRSIRMCSDNSDSIYYVWKQAGTTFGTGKLVISTDTFSKATQVTAHSALWPQITIIGSVLYYCYVAVDTILAFDSFYTASMNTDGTGFAEVEQESNHYAVIDNPFIGADDDTVYYHYTAYNAPSHMTVLAKMPVGGSYSSDLFSNTRLVEYTEFHISGNWIYMLGKSTVNTDLYLAACNKDNIAQIYETYQGNTSFYNAFTISGGYIYTINIFFNAAWDIYTGKVSSEITPIYKWNRVNI